MGVGGGCEGRGRRDADAGWGEDCAAGAAARDAGAERSVIGCRWRRQYISYEIFLSSLYCVVGPAKLDLLFAAPSIYQMKRKVHFSASPYVRDVARSEVRLCICALVRSEVLSVILHSFESRSLSIPGKSAEQINANNGNPTMKSRTCPVLLDTTTLFKLAACYNHTQNTGSSKKRLEA
jgi:hypothetical protein